MEIGERIKYLRQANGLTQEELADRCELTKGFISQLEHDMTSPSIATLTSILEALGVTLAGFFRSTDANERVVFDSEDYATRVDENLGSSTCWLVPNAQKNMMEPILLTLQPGGSSFNDNPHKGEEFGLVLSGSVTLKIGDREEKINEGESFYFEASVPHELVNNGKAEARVVWVSAPPSF
ncbi:MAG TPA: cupin domain-containing protein [Clostridiaceae bacterium]|nr:cupin domain-containing protein [Clostridiaceae bacterium]